MWFMEMDTPATEALVQRLSATGDELGTAWQAAKPSISGWDQGVGNDVLAAAFRSIFQADNEAVRTRAEEIPAALRTAGEAGITGVKEYQEFDTGSAVHFSGGSAGRL
jgi:hypothetical protein